MESPVDSQTAEWVERELAGALQSKVECAPDPERGLSRLRHLVAQRRARRRRTAGVGIGVIMIAALAAALPATRVYASRCLGACVAGGRFVLAKLNPDEQQRSIRHPDRQQAPEFSLEESTGKRVGLADFRGKVVVLNFWATWCNPCRTEIPWFAEFQRTYEARGFTILGVSLDEDQWTSVRPFIAQYWINYPILMGNNEVLQAYGGLESVPTTLIIDRRGRVAATHVGLVSKSTYEKDIVAALNE